MSNSETAGSSNERQRSVEFMRLLSQHERRVYSYILSLVPRWSDADEIQQETNVRLWEQFDTFRQGTDFCAWACTIAYYQVLTFRRRLDWERRHFDDGLLELIAEDSKAVLPETEDRMTAMEACLDGLLPPQRQLLRQCYDGSTTIKQVAAAVGRTVAATYKSVSRLRQILHECIERKLRREREA